MDARDYIRRQIDSMRRLSDGALQGITDEQLNWMPPGTVNSIRAALLHLLGAEDFFIQMILQDKPTVWEAGGWSKQIGLSIPPGRGQGWDEIQSTALALAPVLAYGQAVRAATDDYLAGITPEELDRTARFIGGERPAADVLATLVVHTMTHTGEIAAVRGMQGAKGLPF